MQVNRSRSKGGIEVRLRGVRRVGSIVRLELERLGGGFIEADLTRERYLSEAWSLGEALWVRPHNPKLFLEEKSTVLH